MKRRWLGFVLASFAFAAPAPAHAFTHVVQPGESLASLAARLYGDPKLEGLLAAANGLDAEGGVAPAPGMRLEVPAPSYHRVEKGETWPALAARYLGDANRSDVIAVANGAVPWVPPDKGEEIMIPYVLAVVAGESDRLDTIAKRFWGDPNRAWQLDNYNQRKGAPLKRGELVLVPLAHIALTDAGRAEAKTALGAPPASADADGGAPIASEGDGSIFDIQRRADAEAAEMPKLLRAGRYVDVVVRATRAIASGVLAPKQQAPLERALVEALVALDAREEASRACLRWRAVDPGARLDPVKTSPKVRAVCQTH